MQRPLTDLQVLGQLCVRGVIAELLARETEAVADLADVNPWPTDLAALGAARDLAAALQPRQSRIVPAIGAATRLRRVIAPAADNHIAKLTDRVGVWKTVMSLVLVVTTRRLLEKSTPLRL
jgi:hypothetical protein